MHRRKDFNYGNFLQLRSKYSGDSHNQSIAESERYESPASRSRQKSSLEYLERSIRSQRQEWQDRTIVKISTLASPDVSLDRSVSRILTPKEPIAYMSEPKGLTQKPNHSNSANLLPKYTSPQNNGYSKHQPRTKVQSKGKPLLYIPFIILSTSDQIKLVGENLLEYRNEGSNITQIETFRIPEMITTVSELTQRLFVDCKDHTMFRFIGQQEGKPHLIIQCVTNMVCRTLIRLHPRNLTFDLNIQKQQQVVRKAKQQIAANRVHTDLKQFWSDNVPPDQNIDLTLTVTISLNNGHSSDFCFTSLLQSDSTLDTVWSEQLVYFIGTNSRQSWRTFEQIQSQT